MTNEEAIEIIKQDIPCEHDTDLIEALDAAIQAIKQTIWIPCSKRLPSIAQRVLVSANNGEVFIARFHSIDKWTFEPTGIGYVYDKENIIAWMPLPESYKGE